MPDQPLIDLGHGKILGVSEVTDALSAVGVGPGDIVMVHNRLFALGRPTAGLSKYEYCNRLLSILLDAIGESGTLIAPAWTYTFRPGEIFDVDNTPVHPSLGLFCEIVRRHPGARRSVHPFVSVTAIGKDSHFLVDEVGRSSFGRDSAYDRLHTCGQAKFLTLGLGIPDALTYMHYVEQSVGVVYRYVKEFEVLVRGGGEVRKRPFDHYVTVFDQRDVVANFTKFETVALERQLARRVKVGHGFIQTIDERKCFDLGKEMLEDDPTSLLKITPNSPYAEFIRFLTKTRAV